MAGRKMKIVPANCVGPIKSGRRQTCILICKHTSDEIASMPFFFVFFLLFSFGGMKSTALVDMDVLRVPNEFVRKNKMTSRRTSAEAIRRR